MKRTVAITQSNYLPWRGYFDLIKRVDLVVFLDSVQYTRRDWRNRNRIKTNRGPQWLTIPVEVKGKYFQAVDETVVSDPEWARSHKRSIEFAYKQSESFRSESDWIFEAIDRVADEPKLTRINHLLLRRICDRLAIDTPFAHCTELIDRRELATMAPSERLIELCRAVGASRYISGPRARDYLDTEMFDRMGVEVEWMTYEGYAEYQQLWGEFIPDVSVIDLLFNVGAKASQMISPRTADASR